MAWSVPLTAVANTALTASQWNASVRDNLLMTAPAIATTAGAHFAATGPNAIAQRISQSNTVATSETTTNTSYVNLTTTGPTVNATTGVLAMSFVQCQMSNSGSNSTFFCVDVSVATTDAAADANAAVTQTASSDVRFTVARLHALTAGSNTFQIKYRVSGGTGTWTKRNLFVMPL